MHGKNLVIAFAKNSAKNTAKGGTRPKTAREAITVERT